MALWGVLIILGSAIAGGYAGLAVFYLQEELEDRKVQKEVERDWPSNL